MATAKQRRWAGFLQSIVVLIVMIAVWILIRFLWIDGDHRLTVAEFIGNIVALSAGAQIYLVLTKYSDSRNG